MILTVTANAAIDKRYVVKGFEVDEVNRVKSCEYSAGGKGLNVARVAAIAGEEVVASGFTGGHAGAYIEEAIEKQNVKSDFVRCQGESRSCINIWDEDNKTQTEFLEPGFVIGSQDMDALVAKVEELIDKASVVAVSGSMPAGGTPDLYKRILEVGRAHGVKVILDTSGKTLEECLEAKPYMIKPNNDEIKMLVGRDVSSTEDLLAAADELHAKGIPNVVISRGGEGSIMSCEEGVFVARVPRIEAANTVGCGDSMIAGFCVGIARGLEMSECLKLASAVSAASAMRLETGFFVMEDMEALLPRITVEKLK